MFTANGLGMRHNRFLLAVIIASGLAAVALLARPASMPAKDSEEDDFYGLPNGEGRAEVGIYCAACHSLGLVVQQGLTRGQWDELLVWMVEEQDMEALPKKDRAIVLDYLGKHVGPDSQKQRLLERGILC